MKDEQSELFVVVDEDDTILGYRTRYDCHHNKTLIHRAIGIVIFNDKGEILLQKRSKNKDTDPGKYDIAVSGHVGKGESYIQAAQREMLEEIGITTELTFVKKLMIRFPKETEYDCIFKATYNGAFTINKEEIDEAIFMKKREIIKNGVPLSMFAREALKLVGVL